MTSSPNPAPAPQALLSVAAAILTCCLAGYAVAASLLRRSGTAGAWINAADGVAIAAAVAVLVLLWLAWRAGARQRDDQEERLAQARGREQSLADEQSALRARLDQSQVAQQALALQEAALRQALDHTVARRMPAAFEGRDVPSAELPDDFDAELAKLLDQVVAEAARAGDRAESIRSAVVALSRRVQTAAHRIQEEATLMAERHPGDPDVLEVSMRVDHAAAQQARHAQSMAVLCGEWPGQQWLEPLPLVDVVRAAAGRIIAYRRIEVAGDPDIAATAPAVEPLIHLVAELLANATQSSPPSTSVPVTIRAVQRGAVIEVHDCGVGLDDHRLTQAREIASGDRLIGLDDLGEFPQTGLAVVGQYVRRYGFRVDVSESVYGGVRAIVGIPNDLVETVAPAEALTLPPPAVPAAREDPAAAAEDGRRPLPRRRSPRHEPAGPAAVPTADSAVPDGAAPDGARPAGPLSPEQAGAWMSAFLSGDAGANDRTGERDYSAEQEL
jgi:signal transduction histidine kinase